MKPYPLVLLLLWDQSRLQRIHLSIPNFPTSDSRLVSDDKKLLPEEGQVTRRGGCQSTLKCEFERMLGSQIERADYLKNNNNKAESTLLLMFYFVVESRRTGFTYFPVVER